MIKTTRSRNYIYIYRLANLLKVNANKYLKLCIALAIATTFGGQNMIAQNNYFPGVPTMDIQGFNGIGTQGTLHPPMKPLHILSEDPLLSPINESIIKFGWTEEGTPERFWGFAGLLTKHSNINHYFLGNNDGGNLKHGDFIVSNGHKPALSIDTTKCDLVMATLSQGGNIRFVNKQWQSQILSRQRMVIKPNGNIGIGTDNPAGRLDINFNQWGNIQPMPGFIPNDIFPRISFEAVNNNPSINFTRATGKFNLHQDPENGVCNQNNWEARRWRIRLAEKNIDQMWSTYGALNFETLDEVKICYGDGDVIPESAYAIRMTLLNNGNIGMGELYPKERLHVTGKVRINDPATNETMTGTHSDYRLAVEGKIVAKEIIVTLSNWADFVFDEDYKLPSLASIEKHIAENKHLPGIPKTEEVMKDGVSLGQIQAKLLQKIEELTLYIIQQEKRIAELETKSQGDPK